jgi:hypothetical protein
MYPLKISVDVPNKLALTPIATPTGLNEKLGNVVVEPTCTPFKNNLADVLFTDKATCCHVLATIVPPVIEVIVPPVVGRISVYSAALLTTKANTPKEPVLVAVIVKIGFQVLTVAGLTQASIVYEF